ncbi:hypothetical protein GHT09_012371 [Marmota monax]|uniref:FERM domain-containing protein n=1 Tax=Marmota monax TaxID=9995 RepID=A0A834QDR1_MARMO|nr:hypothetical protein GHT09_012371 [Marmota monax]
MAVGTPHPSQEDGQGVQVRRGGPTVHQQPLRVEPDSVHTLEMVYRAAAGLPPGAADMCGGAADVYQMTEDRHCQVHLLDDRRRELLVQPQLLSRELLDLVASHFNLKQKSTFCS